MTDPSTWTAIDFIALGLVIALVLAIVAGSRLNRPPALWLLPLAGLGPVAVFIVQASLNLSLAGAVITFCVVAGIAFAVMLWNEVDAQ